MSMPFQILIVALTGGLGAVCRFLIEHHMKLSGQPMGLDTLFINTSACLIIGIFAGWISTASWTSETKTAVSLLGMTGFCGGFSTFSTFTLDCVKYYEAGNFITWLVLGTLTIFGGLFSCALGYWIGKHI